MFLHIGGDFSVRFADIISIHDYDSMRKSEDGNAFFSKRKKDLKDFSGGRPKSAVVTDKSIYLSALSPNTLKRRAEYVFSFGTEV